VSDSLAAIKADLDRIVDAALWAHAHGYNRTGRGLDAEHGTDLSKPEHERDAGPVYDLQIGAHTARVAYQHAVTAVSLADRLAAVMLLQEGVTFQHDVEPLTGYARPHELRQCANRLRWRLERITPALHARRLEAVRRNFDRAVRSLSKALDHGPADGIAHGEKMCRTCGIRPSADRKAECDTCATWRRRNGSARPLKLDADAVNQARAAQARRLARNEGWGEA